MKAQMSLNWLIWIIRMFFLIIIVFSIASVVKKYADAHIDISEIHANILTYRLLLNTALTYTDTVTQRIYPLQLNSILPQNFDTYFTYPEGITAAKVSIKSEVSEEIKDIFYKKQTYERLSTLQPTIFGKEYTHKISTYPALANKQPIKLSIDVYQLT